MISLNSYKTALRAADAAEQQLLLPFCPAHFYMQFVRFYIGCWVNKERKKERKKEKKEH